MYWRRKYHLIRINSRCKMFLARIHLSYQLLIISTGSILLAVQGAAIETDGSIAKVTRHFKPDSLFPQQILFHFQFELRIVLRPIETASQCPRQPFQRTYLPTPIMKTRCTGIPDSPLHGKAFVLKIVYRAQVASPTVVGKRTYGCRQECIPRQPHLLAQTDISLPDLPVSRTIFIINRNNDLCSSLSPFPQRNLYGGI